ncbi:unnamed protein product [Prorocentrum cordatum]|uniref:Uncharacterized protein n=1 Tax=Prorocentrum cordatum TaxID=2364126 RepID=A0ABN9T3G9_9DINO|nr:unnamed protein product [Polarella glacialis]
MAPKKSPMKQAAAPQRVVGAKAKAMPKPASAHKTTVDPAPPSTPQHDKVARAESRVLSQRSKERDLEEKASRAIEGKFSSYDQIIIRTRRRADRLTLQTVVENELSRLQGTNKYISTEFWKKMHDDFDLTSPMFSNLPLPTEDADPEQDLIDALALAHDRSKGSRSSEALESYLRHSKALDRTTLLVLLGESREGVVVRRAQSRAMCLAILGHIGSNSLDSQFQDVWGAIKETMEAILVEAIRDMFAKGYQRQYVLRAFDDHARLFCDEGSMERAEVALEAARAIAREDVQELLGTKIGIELYRAEAGDMKYDLFTANCESMLDELEHNDYADTELEGFKNLMDAEMRDLAVFGFKTYQKKECNHEFLMERCKVTLASLRDDFWFRLIARVKSIAVNILELPRLPWEEVLWGGEGRIPGVPETVKVPMQVLKKNKNARGALISLMPRSVALTFAEMRDSVAKHKAECIRMCPDFVHEVSFAMQHAEAVGERIFSEGALGLMPSEQSPKDLAGLEGAIGQLRQDCKGRLCLALSKTFREEVTGAVDFLTMILDGEGPGDIAPMSSPLLSQVADRAKFFYAVPAVQKGPSLFKKKDLVGRDACQQDWADFQKLVADGGDIGAVAHRLRSFKWLLTPAEQEQLNSSIKDRVKRRSSELMSRKAIQDGDAGSGPPSKKGRAAGSKAPSGSEAKLVTASLAPAGKKAAWTPSLGSGASKKEVEAVQGSNDAYKSKLKALFKKKAV